MSVIKYDEVNKDIARVSLNRPEKLNALNRELLQEIVSCLRTANNEKQVVIIEGIGDSFCAGADLDEAQEQGEDIELYQNVTKAVRAFNGLIIGKLHGYVIGGGFELTLSFDLRYADEDTKFQMTESEVGLPISNASSKLLPLMIGEGTARELVFTCRQFDAQEADNLGLIAGVYPSNELESEVIKVAEDIVQSKSSTGLQLNKFALNQAYPLESTLNFEEILNKHELASPDQADW